MFFKSILLSLLLFSSNAFAGYWIAEAYSKHGFGVGISPNLAIAKTMALNECRIRTPYYDYCYITNWLWVD